MSVCPSVRFCAYAPGSSDQPPSIVRTSTVGTAGVGVGRPSRGSESRCTYYRVALYVLVQQVPPAQGLGDRVAAEKVDVRTTVLLEYSGGGGLCISVGLSSQMYDRATLTERSAALLHLSYVPLSSLSLERQRTFLYRYAPSTYQSLWWRVCIPICSGRALSLSRDPPPFIYIPYVPLSSLSFQREAESPIAYCSTVTYIVGSCRMPCSVFQCLRVSRYSIRICIVAIVIEIIERYDVRRALLLVKVLASEPQRVGSLSVRLTCQ